MKESKRNQLAELALLLSTPFSVLILMPSMIIVFGAIELWRGFMNDWRNL